MMRLVWAAALLILVPAAAEAADEEIQVYMDEMNPKRGYGLDLHLNYVPQGRGPDADYLGQESSQGRLRITPEFSYGVTRTVELGAYLPLMEIGPQGGLEIGGVKGRIKFIAPHDESSGLFWGTNFELGRVRHSLDANPWNAEVKEIAGWRSGPVTVAANVNFDFVVAGPKPTPATFQGAIKASYQLQPGFTLGVESYSDLGNARRFRLNTRGDNYIFAVVDKKLGRFDLDFGIGHGYGNPEDRWVVKAILGVPIDPRQG